MLSEISYVCMYARCDIRIPRICPTSPSLPSSANTLRARSMQIGKPTLPLVPAEINIRSPHPRSITPQAEYAGFSVSSLSVSDRNHVNQLSPWKIRHAPEEKYYCHGCNIIERLKFYRERRSIVNSAMKILFITVLRETDHFWFKKSDFRAESYVLSVFF